MVLINLNIFPFFRKGIFLPSVAILSVNNRYIFSCLVEGLYLINGFNLVACKTLNITSNGILKRYSGIIEAFIYLIPLFT